MTKGIRVSSVWSDQDVVELEIEVSDGTSLFCNRVYVGHSGLAQTVLDLGAFKRQVHGGLLDVRFGEFGPEYANGAFHARFHFPKPGRLYITVAQESGFGEFSKKTVASAATLHIRSEPALLDRFVEELRRLSGTEGQTAYLEAV
jgi:hypothetical protein